MDFALSDLQQQIQKLTQDFAAEEVRPRAEEIDKSGRFPDELVKRMVELGLMGMCVPEEWGGSGFDTVSYAIAMENISCGCASTGVIMSVNNSLYCDPMLKNANDGQKEKWLKPYASGQKLGCFGLTESMSGSDAQHMATRAEKKGDRYILRGQKNFITNGPNADAIIVFVATDPSKGSRGTTCFVVPRTSKGYVIESLDKKLGIKGSHSCTISFDECEVPEENRLGEEGG